MPSIREMQIYLKENQDIVWTLQQVVNYAYSKCPAVTAGVDNMVHILHGRIQTYAILIAMGYGSQEARNTLLPLFVANRLEQ